MMDWNQLLAPVRSKMTDNTESRSFFEQDFDRIVFSHPFRKLQDKTQVFPLPEDDFVHTRLTHSLEVSSVGRSLGRIVGDEIIDRYPYLKDLDYSSYDFGSIVAAGSLAHDLGNPPFGHAGENAISEYFRSQGGQKYETHMTKDEWEDLISFEGNAQGYRLLISKSLQLSYPVLGAFSKYPCGSTGVQSKENRVSQKKYGYFQSEKKRFAEMADTLGLIQTNVKNQSWCRHPLAFLVEAADDICYHIIDLEDGCTLGFVDEETTTSLLKEIILDDFNFKKYKKIPTRQQRIGLLRAMAINKLVLQAATTFLENEPEILSGKFDSPLIGLIPSKKVLGKIMDLSVDRLYRSRVVLEIEAAGYEVLTGMMETFSDAMYSELKSGPKSHRLQTIWRLIPDNFKSDENENYSTYMILRRCIDYISGMTDSYAISTFRKIKGISLSGYR